MQIWLNPYRDDCQGKEDTHQVRRYGFLKKQIFFRKANKQKPDTVGSPPSYGNVIHFFPFKVTLTPPLMVL